MKASNPHSRPIYLDHAATTPALPEVVAAMRRVLLEDYANPSSRHAAGLAAEGHLSAARRTVAAAVGVAPAQVIFTSGGTEANGLAVLSGARARGRGRARGGHVLVSAVEHPSVLESARLLESLGGGAVVVERIPVDDAGRVDPDQAASMVRDDTLLASIMHVNNETGVVQPVEAIARAIKRRAPGCRVHTDAVQSFTVLPVELGRLGVDMITLSAHKIHGPKGVGCLIVAPELHLAPLWGGGDQEGQRRPGTENLPGAVGFARAVELARERGQGSEHLRAGCERLLAAVRATRAEAYAIGDPAHRAPQIISIAVPGVATEVLINLLEAQGVCASSGSACHSRRSLRSHVLEAMGIPPGHGVIRLSLSHTTTDDEVERAAAVLQAALRLI